MTVNIMSWAVWTMQLAVKILTNYHYLSTCEGNLMPARDIIFVRVELCRQERNNVKKYTAETG